MSLFKACLAIYSTLIYCHIFCILGVPVIFRVAPVLVCKCQYGTLRQRLGACSVPATLRRLDLSKKGLENEVSTSL